MEKEMMFKTRFLTKRAVKIILVILMVCFFFPFCTVSCGGEKVAEISGLNATVGFTVQAGAASETIEGSLVFGLLLLLPVVMLGLCCMMKDGNNILGNLALIIGGSADTILLFLFKYELETNNEGVEYSYEPAFYLEILLNVLLVVGGIALWMYEKQAPGDIPKSRGTGRKVIEIKDADTGLVCSACGNPLEEDCAFCTNCGTKVEGFAISEDEETDEVSLIETKEVSEPEVVESVISIEEDVKEDKPVKEDYHKVETKTSGLKSTMRSVSSESDMGFTKAGEL